MDAEHLALDVIKSVGPGGLFLGERHTLEHFAAGRGFNLLTLAVSWLAAQPATASVISGATRPEQLPQNAAPDVS